jgi:3-deoxy-D-manno-octulosonic acid (KDO) 8-phosphate synthase
MIAEELKKICDDVSVNLIFKSSFDKANRSSIKSDRGIKLDDAVSMIVNGFCKEVFEELPMEFAVEAKQLIEVTLENSVG